MKHQICLLYLILALVLFNAYPILAEAEQTFTVIINAKNPTSKLTQKEVSQLFLKKVKTWKEFGENVEPVDLADNSEIREAFSKGIHGRKVSSIKAYWQKKIFSGRAVPPPEKESDKEVVKYVEKNTGAIGYISQETSTEGSDVKPIEIVD